jgi:hypothetical protein
VSLLHCSRSSSGSRGCRGGLPATRCIKNAARSLCPKHLFQATTSSY